MGKKMKAKKAPTIVMNRETTPRERGPSSKVIASPFILLLPRAASGADMIVPRAGAGQCPQRGIRQEIGSQRLSVGELVHPARPSPSARSTRSS